MPAFLRFEEAIFESMDPREDLGPSALLEGPDDPDRLIGWKS